MKIVRLSTMVILATAAYLSAGPSAALAGDLVVSGDEHRTYDCRGGSITVEGGSNVLTLRNCSRLIVDGGENTIDAGLVDVIEVSGADNRITWLESPDGRRPRVTNDGEGNVIVSRPLPAGAAPRSTSSSAATSPAPAGPAPASRVTVSGDQVKVQGPDGSVTVGADGSITLKGAATGAAAASGKIRVDKDGLKETYDCRGGSALVNGDRNELSFRNCAQLSINGSRNVVAVLASQSVVINGDDNKVNWEPAEDGARPRITDNGSGNTVSGKR
jgi:Protein of unknown function (DUF3060)